MFIERSGRRHLEQGEADVWFSRVTAGCQRVTDTAVWEWLSRDEKERCCRIVAVEHQYEYLFAHALLRFALSNYCSIEPNEWQFGRDEHSKPFIKSRSGQNLQFNLSHSTGLVGCIISKGVECGIDIESLGRNVEHEKLIEEVCSGRDRKFISGAADHDEQRSRFIECWVLKEAYVKAIGAGVGFGLDRVGFAGRRNQTLECYVDGVRQHGWWFDLYRCEDRFLIASAVSSATANTVQYINAGARG